ncbi:ribosome biogenesis factor YjgA [Hydrogenophilus thermoluteolus]|uniref:Dual-action ribosomal maturation protein DarP n=1 Tax=Hydrogenophilus thermoluteolus TaxID=297 RepID=A0A2Z6DWW6_HYDTE|nr:ribosome biogenesis factor YjgA [Hydrogenophilus thermoluteolus]BBD76964.1 hypothetical protein HPTL_0696 [Hydrogenophilus thermoluteolus]
MEPQELSKTKRKARMHQLQAVGEALLALPVERLRWLALPRDLAQALAEARRLSGHFEAYRRQMQYVGRLLQPYELEPLQALVASLCPGGAVDAQCQREAERLAAEFLADESVVGELLSRFPEFDVPYWRQMRRAALKGLAAEPQDLLPRRRLVAALRHAIEATLVLTLPERSAVETDHDEETDDE